MSVPYTIFRCSSCDYEEHSTVLHGLFYWVDRDGMKCSIKRDLAVCFNCEEVIAAEVFPSEAEIAAEIEAAERDRANAQARGEEFDSAREAALAAVNEPRSWYRSLLLSAGLMKLPQVPSEDARPRMPKDMPEVALKVLAMDRKPVCLNCGSTDIEMLNVPPRGELSDTEPFSTGTPHPNCEGEIHAYSSGLDRIATQHGFVAQIG